MSAAARRAGFELSGMTVVRRRASERRPDTQTSRCSRLPIELNGMGHSDPRTHMPAQLHLATGIGRGNNRGPGASTSAALRRPSSSDVSGCNKLYTPAAPQHIPTGIHVDRGVAGGDQNRPRLVDDPLGMAQVARVLHGHRTLPRPQRREAPAASSSATTSVTSRTRPARSAPPAAQFSYSLRWALHPAASATTRSNPANAATLRRARRLASRPAPSWAASAPQQVCRSGTSTS